MDRIHPLDQKRYDGCTEIILNLLMFTLDTISIISSSAYT